MGRHWRGDVIHVRENGVLWVIDRYMLRRRGSMYRRNTGEFLDNSYLSAYCNKNKKSLTKKIPPVS